MAIHINSSNSMYKNTNIVNGSATGSIRTIGSATEDSSYTIGIHATAEGYGTKASGKYSHAEGYETVARIDSGIASFEGGPHAEGYRSIASGGIWFSCRRKCNDIFRWIWFSFGRFWNNSFRNSITCSRTWNFSNWR